MFAIKMGKSIIHLFLKTFDIRPTWQFLLGMLSTPPPILRPKYRTFAGSGFFSNLARKGKRAFLRTVKCFERKIMISLFPESTFSCSPLNKTSRDVILVFLFRLPPSVAFAGVCVSIVRLRK